MNGTWRVRDSQIVEHDLRQMRPIDRYTADGDFALQPRFERRTDTKPDEIAETRRAEVIPAAADDQKKDDEKEYDSADEPTQASPHRPSPLALSRCSVVALVGRPFGYIQSICGP